jgi:hypothetical protein
MGQHKIDHEHEVGGFNPERRKEKPKSQVGPAPTDDPRGKAMPDLKHEIDRKRPQVSPDQEERDGSEEDIPRGI